MRRISSRRLRETFEPDECHTGVGKRLPALPGFDPDLARPVDHDFDHIRPVENRLQRAELFLHRAPGFLTAIARVNP